MEVDLPVDTIQIVKWKKILNLWETESWGYSQHSAVNWKKKCIL